MCLITILITKYIYLQKLMIFFELCFRIRCHIVHERISAWLKKILEIEIQLFSNPMSNDISIIWLIWPSKRINFRQFLWIAWFGIDAFARLKSAFRSTTIQVEKKVYCIRSKYSSIFESIWKSVMLIMYMTKRGIHFQSNLYLSREIS